MMKEKFTQQGYQKLLDELNYRRGELREKIKNDIQVARSFGDLSENSEYDVARNDQMENEERIKKLEEQIENAEIIDESDIDTSVISLGSTVVVELKNVYDDPDTAEEDDVFGDGEKTFYLVGSNEANPFEFKLSDQSRIGESLVGKKAGDEIEVESPDGKIQIRILEVSRSQN